MKKLTKILLIICAIVFISGGLLCVIGFAGGASLYEANGRMPAGWNLWPFWNRYHHHGAEVDVETGDVSLAESAVMETEEVGSHEQVYSAADVDKLELEANFADIVLQTYEGDKISVRIDGLEAGEVLCQVDGNKLEVKDTMSKSKFYIPDHQDVSIVIMIPEEKVFEKFSVEADAGSVYIERIAADKIKLDIGAGTLECEQIVSASKMELDAGAGEITLYQADLNELDVDCGAGQISISGAVKGDVKADCGVGYLSFQLDGKETDYNYKLECGAGGIAIDGSSYSALAMEKKIDNGAQATFQLKCGVGYAEVMFQ